MNPLKFFKILFLLTLTAILFAGCAEEPDIVVINDSPAKTSEKNDAAKKYKIYLITMDLADDFWKSIDSGCRQAVEEIGDIDYTWTGPDVNEDAPQMKCIDDAVAAGADALVIAASSPRGIIPSLEKAAAKGVKIVFVDNAAEFEYVAFLATDNELAGTIAGETLKKGLAEAGLTSGTIGITANKNNVTSTNLRIKGFRRAFEGSNFTLTDTFFMEDNDQSLKDFAAAHTEYIAFFGSNERTARNIGEQMKASRSKQIVMGFDTSDSVLTLLNEGYLYATLQQKPQRMGHDGIKIAVETLDGTYTKTNTRVDTGVNVIDKDSI